MGQPQLNGSVELSWGLTAFLRLRGLALVVGPPEATSATGAGASVSVPVACKSGPGATCRIRLTLSVTARGHSTVIGTGTAAVPAGSYTNATVPVNAAGKRLLRTRRHVSAALSVGGPRGRETTIATVPLT
jgi:hypothetical protein